MWRIKGFFNRFVELSLALTIGYRELPHIVDPTPVHVQLKHSFPFPLPAMALSQSKILHPREDYFCRCSLQLGND